MNLNLKDQEEDEEVYNLSWTYPVSHKLAT